MWSVQQIRVVKQKSTAWETFKDSVLHICNSPMLQLIFSSGTNPTARATNWGKCRASLLTRVKGKLSFTVADKKMKPTGNAVAPMKMFNCVKGNKG